LAKVVDIHSHVLLPGAFEGIPEKYSKEAPRLAEAPGRQAYVEIGKERRGPVPKAFWSLPERLDEMEREGVDMEILSVFPYTFFYWLSTDSATEFAKRQNDAIAGAVKEYRRSFRGMATVPLQDVSAAIDELERAIRKLGLVGAEIGTNVNGRNLDDPTLDPFFAKAEELGALVFVHPIRAAGLERMRSYYLPVLVGNPSETSLAVASMMFGGVLERHRRLKICFAHGGGFIPYQIGRLNRGYEVRSESRAAAKARPSSFLGKVYFDTIVYDESALSFLVSSMGAHNVLLGSDSPLDMHDHRIVKKVRSLSSCSEKEKEMILGGNIERLVRI
jgi:aminocarboxymuconate-semialdehyde decarboxylase